VIQVKDLTIAFGRTVAINDLSVEIGPGVFGLFGQNGSGKSTLLRAIAGLVRPTYGDVIERGRRVDLSDETFRRSIGYAGHESGLYGRLTVGENLRLFGSLYGVGAGRVGDVIRGLDLGRFEHTRAEALSAGTRRRASVARALLHEPPILLLDEPYANLDDEAANLVSAAVEPWKTGERIALIATHGAKKVKAFADGGIILRDGRLVMQGRYDHPNTATAST
jgi:heme ABC exporter ATP-binding subunit CcmA